MKAHIVWLIRRQSPSTPIYRARRNECSMPPDGNTRFLISTPWTSTRGRGRITIVLAKTRRFFMPKQSSVSARRMKPYPRM